MGRRTQHNAGRRGGNTKHKGDIPGCQGNGGYTPPSLDDQGKIAIGVTTASMSRMSVILKLKPMIAVFLFRSLWLMVSLNLKRRSTNGGVHEAQSRTRAALRPTKQATYDLPVRRYACFGHTYRSTLRGTTASRRSYVLKAQKQWQPHHNRLAALLHTVQ